MDIYNIFSYIERIFSVFSCYMCNLSIESKKKECNQEN